MLPRLAMAAVAGAGAGLSFEPFRLVYLLPVAVAVLTLTCRKLSLPRGFLVGAAFGVAFMLTLLPWLQVIGLDAWILLSVLEGLFYGLLGLGTAAVVRLRWWPLWTAALWVAVEALRGVIPFGGFPWGRLAFATIDTPVAPLFAFLGSAGVTFAVGLVGSVLAWTVLRVRRMPVRAVAALVLTCLVVSLGSALPGPGRDKDASGGVTVAAVQGNVPGVGMNAFAERRAVLDNHLQATRGLAADVEAGQVDAPDLVVWPESSTDIDPFTDPTVSADIQGVVDAIGVPILVGAMVAGPETDEVRNQGIVWSPGSGPGESYSKTHPVPFGEYIPFRDLLAKYVTRLDQIPRDMVAGSEPGLLEIAGITVGDVICFEVAYDGVVRDVIKGDADMLVVQTNNATYTGTGQIEQQFAISRLRAIETNRFVVVAATNGVSGVIAPDGQVVARAATRTQAALVESVRFPGGTTAGIRYGAWVELALAAVAVITAFVGIAAGRRRRPLRDRQPVDAGAGHQ